MKNKIFYSNDTTILERSINEWMKTKQIVNISDIVFVHGAFIVQIFYYDKELDLNNSTNNE